MDCEVLQAETNKFLAEFDENELKVSIRPISFIWLS